MFIAAGSYMLYSTAPANLPAPAWPIAPPPPPAALVSTYQGAGHHHHLTDNDVCGQHLIRKIGFNVADILDVRDEERRSTGGVTAAEMTTPATTTSADLFQQHQDVFGRHNPDPLVMQHPKTAACVVLKRADNSSSPRSSSSSSVSSTTSTSSSVDILHQHAGDEEEEDDDDEVEESTSISSRLKFGVDRILSDNVAPPPPPPPPLPLPNLTGLSQTWTRLVTPDDHSYHFLTPSCTLCGIPTPSSGAGGCECPPALHPAALICDGGTLYHHHPTYPPPFPAVVPPPATCTLYSRHPLTPEVPDCMSRPASGAHHHYHPGSSSSSSSSGRGGGYLHSMPFLGSGGGTGGGHHHQGSSNKRKRSWSRAVFSNLQRKGLEKRFQIQKYITKPDRRQLAATLGLTDAQVKVWFQNRRMKWRHSKEAKEEFAKQASSATTTTEEEVVVQGSDKQRPKAAGEVEEGNNLKLNLQKQLSVTSTK